MRNEKKFLKKNGQYGILPQMYVESISLEHFRNYHSRKILFPRPGAFLCGRNGCGKTNLLESIYLLSYGKSFRSSNNEELLMFSKEHFAVSGTFNGPVKKVIEYRFSKGEKKVLINGVAISSMRELIGNIALVFLSLSDIDLVLGNPLLRRQYLDAVLSVLYTDYLSDLLDYRKILRQRNRLLYLHKIGKRENVNGIEGWTEELVQVGSRIISQRLSIMEEMDETASRYYAMFAPSEDTLTVAYDPSVKLDGSIEESFSNALKRRSRSEMERGVTLVGPHRDDLFIDLNGIPARKFASEGEQRTCAISLKLAQAAFLKQRMKDDPILLIDEAIAELDSARKEKVLRQVTDIGQCFVATTNCSVLRGMIALEVVEIDNHTYAEDAKEITRDAAVGYG